MVGDRHSLVLFVVTSALGSSMIFPNAGAGYGPSADAQQRNKKMAGLLGAMIATPADSALLLRDAAPMLLAPFYGEPEPGSIYGDSTSDLDGRITAYKTAMAERISRASPDQAVALQTMLDFVLGELGFECTPDGNS